MTVPGLYMDVHVPAAVTDGLRRRGVDVLTSQEDGTREASDEDLLDRATLLGRPLVSQDRDLLRIAAERQSAGRAFAGVIFAAQGIGVGVFVADLELLAACAETAELADRVTYLPLP